MLKRRTEDVQIHGMGNQSATQMTTELTFEDAIIRLQQYWAKQDCLVWSPSTTEVGAGTMNSATFLRVLGPEPWRVCYPEPSQRPDDSRYGENPNRVQMHTQFQVILKPDPGNPQELYLGSLAALGVDLAKHDVRFVEDNWESPALGAWGLGWEVWLDGLEITQFTYFQQAGGFVLSPISVEITYGLERILMLLQRVDHFKKIHYSHKFTYGELFAENEYEMSVYNLDVANVPTIVRLFDDYENEARSLIEKRLPIPAYSYILKASHAFNLLDARGAIGVTERARYFAKMRDLARRVAQLWISKREDAGFPLVKSSLNEPWESTTVQWLDGDPQTFLLEVGTEELPPADVEAACAQLGERFPRILAESRLKYEDITVEATPRRLVVEIKRLRRYQQDEIREVKGPLVSTAFGADGTPTKAALGFARAQRVEVADLHRQTVDGKEYVAAFSKQEILPAGQVLSTVLPEILRGITFKKSMRWNSSDVAFSRPIRWIVALFGDNVVPFTYAGITSGRTSKGLRGATEKPIDVINADTYRPTINAAGVILSSSLRQKQILNSGDLLASSINGRIPEPARSGLVKEVANLIEAPTPLLGQFDTEYLRLPKPVLVTVMEEQQRYFPIEDLQGNLLPNFILIANGNIDCDEVRSGNEAVLKARYSDAAFFWEHDLRTPVDSLRPHLAKLVFQERLGSMLDKNQRLEQAIPMFSELLNFTREEESIALRAAQLSKANLVTQMVTEFSSLAGVMGREYALAGGESPQVAEAIYEHVLPRFATDDLPKSRPGILLAVMDRLDSILGLFSVGLSPTAETDPFALRRAAVGIVQILVERNVDLDLRAALSNLSSIQPISPTDEVLDQSFTFILKRFEQWLLERGERYDLVNAVISERGQCPALAFRTLEELKTIVETNSFRSFLTAYSRASRIVESHSTNQDFDERLIKEPEESNLWSRLLMVTGEICSQITIHEFLKAFAPLVNAINEFFENVFVMSEDAVVRDNRIALLTKVARLSHGIVDFSKIRGF